MVLLYMHIYKTKLICKHILHTNGTGWSQSLWENNICIYDMLVLHTGVYTLHNDISHAFHIGDHRNWTIDMPYPNMDIITVTEITTKF